jgi:hypothetical protein
MSCHQAAPTRVGSDQVTIHLRSSASGVGLDSVLLTLILRHLAELLAKSDVSLPVLSRLFCVHVTNFLVSLAIYLRSALRYMLKDQAPLP